MHHNAFPALVTCLLPISLLPASASAQALSIRTVALSGQPAPGTAPGATEGTFGATFRVPVINNAGHVAFISALNGVPSASQGIWAETDDGLRLVTRAGLAAPGTSNAILDFPTPQYLNINDSDDILFACNVFNRGLSLIARRDDTPAFVAYPGLAAPGTANTFATIYASSAAFNSSGQVAFYARLAGVSQIDGIWVDDGAILASRVLEGDPTPGLPDFTFFSLVPSPNNAISFNDSGRIAFAADVRSLARNDASIWRSDPSGLLLIQREDDLMPEFMDATFLRAFSPIGLNADGHFFYGTSFAGPGYGDNPQVYYHHDNGTFYPVARTETAIVGGLAEYSALNPPATNAQGRSAFYALLEDGNTTGLNNYALFRDSGQGTPAIPIYRMSDPAPGIPGTLLTLVSGAGASREFTINASGQIAFSTNLRAEGSTTSSGNALWLTDADAVMHLVARSGMLFDVDDGPGEDLRTVITGAIFPASDAGGGQGGRPRVLNDAGQFVVRLRFTDNTEGVFVASLTCPDGSMYPCNHCPVCAADYDQNGGIDGGDLGAFFLDFEQGLPCADVDLNGGVDGGDLGAFFVLFEAGGC